MSGGQLVVLDRLGRDVKRFPLAEGIVTLGSDHSCDIRFMLDSVDPHHATVAVHANQTVVRAVCGGATLVNGRAVSVAALRHGDVITISGRRLRWDYERPDVRRAQAPAPALHVARRAARGGRRGSGPAGAPRREPALRAALELAHRASMPANAGGKQVAIVQPQRRDTSEQIDTPAPRSPQSSKRPRAAGEAGAAGAAGAAGGAGRRAASLAGGAAHAPAATKASQWIESRKSTPLRLAVLRRAQGARRPGVAKIQAPAKIDHMKQAAILLMTGHTPKSKLLSQKTPSPKSASAKLPSPKSAGSAPSLRRSASLNVSTPKSASPKLSTSKSASPRTSPKPGGQRWPAFFTKRKSSIRKSTPRGRAPRASPATPTTPTPRDQTVTILDATESDVGNSTRRSSSRRSGHGGFQTSPPFPSPKKSALKNPLAKKNMRKTESIKFDLSNLENRSQESVGPGPADTTGDSLPLQYSDASPSPRRSIHSRPSASETPPRGRRSVRGAILQRALSAASYSRRATTSVSLLSGAATPLSPRRSRPDLESYSIVDLLSVDSSASARSMSVYDSAVSDAGSPRGNLRRTRSTLEPALLGSSTPCVGSAASRSDPDVSTATSDSVRSTDADSLSGTATRVSLKSRSSNSRSRLHKSGLSIDESRLSGDRSRLSSGGSESSTRSIGGSRKTKKSLSTPENASIPISVNSTRVSRASRSRSRIDDSDLLFVELDEADDSPRSSRRTSTASKRSSSAPQGGSVAAATNATPIGGRDPDEGISTPENAHSPEEARTPVLSIQSLLDQSGQSSIRSQFSRRRGRPSLKRKTIGVPSGPRLRLHSKSKSLNFSARNTRRKVSDDSYENVNLSDRPDGEIVTPKSAVKLVQEAVKNKHSTAKKPQSKRSIIDDLNESAAMKQLFNSPVKRKLSQSMTEISRKQLFDDEEPDESRISNLASRTGTPNAPPGRKETPDDSLLDRTEAFSPERFVSPISTPGHSPNLAGVKRLFGKQTPQNDLRDVRGVRALLRTPRARRSARDELSDVAGVKALFAGRASRATRDLRRLSGVKALFRSQQERKSPRNSLGDVRGVKKLFDGRSPADDLRNVSGVRRALRGSPRNELSDVSGVEELFDESNDSPADSESLFDRLVGRPAIKSVYSRTFSSKRESARRRNSPKSKSLLASLDVSLNTEEWLKRNLEMLHELRRKRSRPDAEPSSESVNGSKPSVTRELLKLSTETVVGSAPLRASRVRASRVARASPGDPPRQKSTSESYSAHTLPIKKRSLVDASLDRTKNDSRHVNLPIKKRAVVHSTPMKGRQINMTMNASELGRVSPIVAEKPRDLEHDVPSSTIQKEPTEARSKSRRAAKAQTSAVSPKDKKASPRKARGKSKVPTPTKTASTPTKEKSPAKIKTPAPAKKAVSPVTKPASAKRVTPKSTRSRRAAPVSPKADAKKRGAKLVVAKKSPVMSPRPRASRKRKEPDSLPTPKATPKRTRAIRSKVVEKSKTPKNTRAKVLKLTVAVVKPSPQSKPRVTRRQASDSNGAEKSQEAVEPKATRKAGTTRVTRKVGVKRQQIESPQKSPVPSPKKSRRKSPKEGTVEVAPKTRGKGKTAAANDRSEQSRADVAEAQPKTRRGRAANVGEAVVPKKARKIDKQESVQESKTVTKKSNKQEKPAEEPKVTRGKKIIQQESVSSELTARSRRGAKPENIKPAVNTRKRKSEAPDDRPAKVSRNTESVATRARSKKIESPRKDPAPVAKKTRAGRNEQTGKRANADVPKKTTRAKKVEVAPEGPKGAAPRSTRGKKNATVEVAPDVGKRKRRPAIESPVAARGAARRRR